MQEEEGNPSLEAPQVLHPPHPMGVAVLPSSDRKLSVPGSVSGSVRRVYPQALEFIDHVAAMGGYASSLGVLLLLGSLSLLLLTVKIGSTLLFMWATALCFISLIFIQVDWVGFRYNPVLLNRTTGKIHVFASGLLPWWQWGWNLWGRPPGEVRSYDWDLIRGEIVQVSVFTGQIVRREQGLVFAVTEFPGSPNVVERFGVGTMDGYGLIDGLLSRWEFIRAFMRNEGPLWRPGDGLYAEESEGFWESLLFLQPIHWLVTDSSTRRQWWMWPLGLLMLKGLPLTAYIGLMRYLSGRFKREPVWPKEVLDTLGGQPLTEAELLEIASAEAGDSKVAR